MKSFFLSFILIIGLTCIIAETEESVVYYVSPTESLHSCPGNSSCPPDQLCHTMDYFVQHSSEFFTPNHTNITLIFMCGVHNYTKDVTLQNLHSFVMKGAAESRRNVIIDHQLVAQSGKPNCTIIQFFSISFVSITNLTMICPSVILKESHITVKTTNIYGYSGIKKSLSFINITGRGSQALLDNCTFTENCAIVSNFSDGIIVSNSTFQSYRHQYNSVIVAFSSVVTLTGNVNFTDSITGIDRPYYSSGTAVFLRTTHPAQKSSLNITTGATVYFVNLTCSNYGGAVYGENSMIHVSVQARVVFMYNVAISHGGAVCLINGTISVGAKSSVVFMYNVALVDASLQLSYNYIDNIGGALRLENGKLIINSTANVTFSNNSANKGGAVSIVNSTVYVDTDDIYFYNNTSLWGGAIYFVYSTLYINKSVKFIMNIAQVQGGAIYIESDVSSSIIVGSSAKLLLLNNSAFQGGALYIPSSFTITVGYQSSVQFINNTAFDVGGAVCAETQSAAPCLFMVTDYSAGIRFKGNYANHSVGHHMYGTSVRDYKCDREHVLLVNKQGKPYCWHNTHDEKNVNEHINISFVHPGLNETLSSVSSAPWRVCLCDSNGKPQCATFSQIFTNVILYRGETFTLSAHVVGYDFGTTVGIIHAGFLTSSTFSQLGPSQENQPVKNSETCTTLKYTVLTKLDMEVLKLHTSVLPVPLLYKYTLSKYKRVISGCIGDYYSHENGCLNEELRTTPVFVNITLLPDCPPGLSLTHDLTECRCFPILANNGFKYSIQNKSGLLQWNSTMWVNATFNDSHSIGIIYNRFCPLNYCNLGNKTVNIGDNPSRQCASNRTGILCGACMTNFSLAIGSSRCIECHHSHNVAFLLVFAAAGVFIVFFILALNLTVTQGLINGVIFYANIVWAYKIILFPSDIGGNYFVTILKVFIAWLNLDFGIETCFLVGLDAYWKTWLQFLFPFYIWAIAGVIIVACRYSSRLTNLIGSRAVPLLATLFLLSYMKLLRTVIDATSVAMITHYPQNTSYAVWYLDGNLHYCQYPHIYLFITATATLVFLWLPYTLLLLFIQCLRRVSHLRPLKWINKFVPVYDAYFSPLKDKYQYWFGIMLLVRGILLIILTATSAASPQLNVFISLLVIALLFFFISVKNINIYKRMTVRFLENATLLNLIILSAGTLYKWESTMARMLLLEVSIGITFAQFCVIVVLSLTKMCLSAHWSCRRNQAYGLYDIIDQSSDDDILM